MAAILLIDDDPDFQDMMTMVLRSAGYQVRSAFNGEQAFGVMAGWRPDLVILDVMMTTDTEGFAVARRIRSDPDLAGMPIIMLTAIHREKDLPYRFTPDDDWLPVNAFLDKPVKPHRLLRAVADALTPSAPAGGTEQEIH